MQAKKKFSAYQWNEQILKMQPLIEQLKLSLLQARMQAQLKREEELKKKLNDAFDRLKELEDKRDEAADVELLEHIEAAGIKALPPNYQELTEGEEIDPDEAFEKDLIRLINAHFEDTPTLPVPVIVDFVTDTLNAMQRAREESNT